MLKTENLVTVKQYARLCGIQNIAVRRRIKNNIITAISVSGVRFIDIERHPPAKRNPYGKRSNESPLYNLSTAVDEIGWPVNLTRLITATQYAAKAGVRQAAIYKKIILKQMEAVVIGDVIFIDEEKYPPEQYELTRKPAKKRNKNKK